MLDTTHDPALKSWVESANGHADFPIQNLPFGVFHTANGSARGGVAIGDFILDIGAAHGAGLFTGEATRAAEAASGDALNALFALGAAPRRALRTQLNALLAVGAAERAKLESCLHEAASCTMQLPARIGDYTDFFAGIQHAINGGKLFRPDNPLLPNYKYVPVAYHGRASSVRASGHAVVRPNGQRMLAGENAPSFGPCRNLDYEYELGIWIGPGNAQGTPIPIAQAATHIAGFCMLNDWSARHPTLGIAAARPLPGEEFLHDGFALGDHAGGDGALPRGTTAAAGGRSRTARLFAGCDRPGKRRARPRA